MKTLQLKYLHKVNQAKNDQTVNYVHDALIDLRNTVNKNKIPENENLDEVISIVENMLNFDKQQKGKGLKILTPKLMLQRLPIALIQQMRVIQLQNH